MAGDHDLITATRAQLDLMDQRAVHAFMQAKRPDMVIIAAAKVGGILANRDHPAAFIHDNIMIASNVIHEAHMAGVDRLLQLGSSCIYPRDAAQPICETALLTGPLEPTNAPYAVAKIAAITLCESYNRQYGRDYRSLMPTNLYGPGDNFHPQNAHVLPGLIQRFHAAARAGADNVSIWGTGTPRREFLHVDDLADAALFVMSLDQKAFAQATHHMPGLVNVGTGTDLPIIDLAQMIADLAGFKGTISTDPSKPDGTPRKCLDTRLMRDMGWTAKISLAKGLAQTYEWYLAQIEAGQNLRAS